MTRSFMAVLVPGQSHASFWMRVRVWRLRAWHTRRRRANRRNTVVISGALRTLSPRRRARTPSVGAAYGVVGDVDLTRPTSLVGVGRDSTPAVTAELLRELRATTVSRSGGA